MEEEGVSQVKENTNRGVKRERNAISEKGKAKKNIYENGRHTEKNSEVCIGMLCLKSMVMLYNDISYFIHRKNIPGEFVLHMP